MTCSKEMKDYEALKRESDFAKLALVQQEMKRESELVVKFVQVQLEQMSSNHLYRKELFEWLAC